MEQNFTCASLCRNFSKVEVMITAEPLGGKQHPPKISRRQERLWPEENSRANYALKKALSIIKEQEILNMDDPLVSFAVS